MSGPQDQRPPRRRALPTVSDVVRELRGSTTAEPELLFKAARQVCAEELNRAKQGFEPAPMEILVKRARRLLGVVEDMPTLRMERPEEMAAAGAPGAPPAAESPLAFVFEPDPEPQPEPPLAPAPVSPPVPRLAPAQPAAPAPTPRFVLSAAEEPFLETTGSIDLKGIWSRKVSLLDDPLAPLGESTPTLAPPPPSAVPEGPTMALPLGGIDLLTPPAEPLPASPAPFQVEELPSAPVPIAAPVPVTVAVEPPTAPPAEGEAPPTAAAGTPEPSPLEPQPRAEPVSVLFPDGPGDETLDRLKVEAAAVRFEEVLPSLEPPAAPVVPDAPAPLPPPSLPEPVPAPKAIAPPAVEPLPEVPLPAAKEGVEKGSGAVRWKDVEAETSSLFSPAAVAPARSRAPLIAAVVILGAGAAAWYLLRTGQAASPVPAPVPAPTSAPTEEVAPPTVSTPPAAAPTEVPAAPAPATAAPATPKAAAPTAAPTAVPSAATPVPTKKAEAAPAPSVVRTQTTAPAPGQSRAATVTTPDWAGKEPVFALHFSSYRDRATADKDAARLGKSLERPGRAISIDLGEKGVWYRVMIGEFATVEEALAYRAELEQKGTPNMGFVYRIVGKAP